MLLLNKSIFLKRHILCRLLNQGFHSYFFKSIVLLNRPLYLRNWICTFLKVCTFKSTFWIENEIGEGIRQKSEFFWPTAFEILKIFACGAEKVRNLASWVQISKNFRLRRNKKEEIWLLGLKISKNFRLRRWKSEFFCIQPFKILTIYDFSAKNGRNLS